jgi:hypothetical protein
VEKAELILYADEPCGAVLHGSRCLVELPYIEIGAADLTHLALLDELVERCKRVRNRCGRVWLVQLVEVDTICPQSLQARLDSLADIGRLGAMPAFINLHAELGRQDKLVTPPG